MDKLRLIACAGVCLVLRCGWSDGDDGDRLHEHASQHARRAHGDDRPLRH